MKLKNRPSFLSLKKGAERSVFDDIIASIEEAFVVLDAQDQVLYANEKAKAVFPELEDEGELHRLEW